MQHYVWSVFITHEEMFLQKKQPLRSSWRTTWCRVSNNNNSQHIQESFFIEKLYSVRALVWLPTEHELWPLLVTLSTYIWVEEKKIKLFLQEHSEQGSLWCRRYFCQRAPASFSWAPPSPLLHSWWQRGATSPSPGSPGSGFPPPEGQAVTSVLQ